MYSRYVILSMATILLSLASSKTLASPSDLNIPYYDSENVDISVDGNLDEKLWKKAAYHDDFVVVSPDLGETGRYRTLVSYFYTSRGLYVGMWNEQPAETLLSRFSSRDGFLARDSMQIVVDTTGEGLYAYWFAVSLGGSMGDGIVLPERQYHSEWDGAWYGNAVATENGWTAELFIPWAIMEMPPVDTAVRNMGLYVSRSLGELGERWSNPYLSNRQNRFLSALNTYEFKSLAQSKEFSFFPYSSASIDNIRQSQDYRAGLDVFWRPSSNLQLSAALNPDFGQVEADDAVVNLTAFETFFPEKRLFFLENQGVFSTIGRKGSSDTLLNTRRIGSNVGSRQGEPDNLDNVTSFDRNKPVDMIGAVKATGQTGRIRYSVLAASEDDTDVNLGDTVARLSGRDFGVARGLYENTGDGGRRSIGWMGTVTDHPNRQAITQGIDAHLLSNDGRLSFDGQVMTSDVEDTRGYGLLANISFVPKHGHTHDIEIDYIDRHLNLNDLGFLARTDQVSLKYHYELEENHLPGLRERESDISIKETRNLNHKRTGGDVVLQRKWEYNDNSEARIGLSYKPKIWDDRNSRGHGDFEREETWGVWSRWRSDRADTWSYEVQGMVQQEHKEGYKQSLRGEIFFRPTGRYSLSLRADYEKRDSWMIHDAERNFTAVRSEKWSPKLIFNTFFSARQQLQIQLQWIGLRAHDESYWEVPVGGGKLQQVTRPIDDTSDGFTISDITLQARYRWEIAPLSDLFVVYNRGGSLALSDTDSGFGSIFSDAFSDPTAETLVVKLRYRFGPG
ncbi:MAG TPA: hypothetical protein DCM54_12930 [Gammaproteobacteria bacterium]|nr:hypothetical protein [Gammaproteobacteria bacterium]